MDHPSRVLLDRFIRLECSASENILVVRHLLKLCPPCRAQIANILGTKADYSEAFRRAAESAATYRCTSDAEADKLVDELEERPLRRNLKRFHNPRLVERLLAAAAKCRWDDPMRCARLSQAAHEISKRSGIAPSLRLLAQAEYGNAVRLLGDHRTARYLIDAAVRDVLGSAEKAVRARVLSIAGTFYADDRRLSKANHVLEEALVLWGSLGNLTESAVCLLQLGEVNSFAGLHERALSLATAAGELIHGKDNGRLAIIVAHNSAMYHLYAGRAEDCLAVLDAFRFKYREIGGDLAVLKHQWLRGGALLALNQPEAALALLAKARAGLVDRSQVYEVALISLDYVGALVALGRLGDVAEVARQTYSLATAAGADEVGLQAIRTLRAVTAVGMLAKARAVLHATSVYRFSDGAAVARKRIMTATPDGIA